MEEKEMTIQVTIKWLYHMLNIKFMTIENVITDILIESNNPLVNIITQALLKLKKKYWDWEI